MLNWQFTTFLLFPLDWSAVEFENKNLLHFFLICSNFSSFCSTINFYKNRCQTQLIKPINHWLHCLFPQLQFVRTAVVNYDPFCWIYVIHSMLGRLRELQEKIYWFHISIVLCNFNGVLYWKMIAHHINIKLYRSF